MLFTLLRVKLHRIKVAESEINYEGSNFQGTGFVEFEKEEVYNVGSGNRLSTYIVPSDNPDKNYTCINGAIAYLTQFVEKLFIFDVDSSKLIFSNLNYTV